MKKLISIFFAVIYLATTSGMVLEVHHCMGKVAGFGFIKTEKERCGKCGMEKGGNACCKEELKFVKLQDSHNLLSTDYKFLVFESLVPREDGYYQKALSQVSIKNLSNHSPPYRLSTPLRILYSVFRI